MATLSGEGVLSSSLLWRVLFLAAVLFHGFEARLFLSSCSFYGFEACLVLSSCSFYDLAFF